MGTLTTKRLQLFRAGDSFCSGFAGLTSIASSWPNTCFFFCGLSFLIVAFLCGLSLRLSALQQSTWENAVLKTGADRGETFQKQVTLGVPGPTEFQISLFSHSGAFEKLLKVSPLSLLRTSQQVAQASVILKSNMTALLSIGFHFHTDFRVDIPLPPCYQGKVVTMLKETANIIWFCI